MKYSSITSPSARTITNRCFPGISSTTTSSSSSHESLSVDDCDDGEQSADESYTLDERRASPESRQIMAESKDIYESSPIPKSYLNSPPKKSPVVPKIALPKSAARKANNKSKVAVKKKSMAPSEMLTKQKGGAAGRNRTSTRKSFVRIYCLSSSN